MTYKLIKAIRFKRPLKGNPQLIDGKLWFPYIDYEKSKSKSYFGIMEYDLTSGCTKYDQAPFYIQDEFVTVNYTRFVMHPCLNKDFIISLAWESNYDIKYRFYKISNGIWFDIDIAQDEKHIIRIDKNTKVDSVKANKKISLKKYALVGGTLYCWKDDDKICFAVDNTHAFENDNSAFTEKNSILDKKLSKISTKKSNMNYLTLSAYLKEYSLPDGIPANHSILLKEYIHNYWVLENGEELFFLNNDFHKNGFTDLLYFKKG